MVGETPERGGTLTFGEFQAVLARTFLIAPAKRDTFTSRLKQWQKMGFPEVERVGRGARIGYTLEHLVQVAVLARIMDTGVTPDRAIGNIKRVWPQIFGTAAVCLGRLGSGDPHDVYGVMMGGAFEEITSGSSKTIITQYDEFDTASLSKVGQRPIWSYLKDPEYAISESEYQRASESERRTPPARVMGTLETMLRGAIIFNMSEIVRSLLVAVRMTISDDALIALGMEYRGWLIRYYKFLNQEDRSADEAQSEWEAQRDFLLLPENTGSLSFSGSEQWAIAAQEAAALMMEAGNVG